MGDDYAAKSERVTVRGTKTSCKILVDGAPVELADYPFAAWELDLTWTLAPPAPPRNPRAAGSISRGAP